jgi:hypothetical protein
VRTYDPVAGSFDLFTVLLRGNFTDVVNYGGDPAAIGTTVVVHSRNQIQIWERDGPRASPRRSATSGTTRGGSGA